MLLDLDIMFKGNNLLVAVCRTRTVSILH